MKSSCPFQFPPFLRATLESASIMGTDWNSHLPSLRPLSAGLPRLPPGLPKPALLSCLPYSPLCFCFSFSDYCSCQPLLSGSLSLHPSLAQGKSTKTSDKKLWVNWSLLWEVLTLCFNYSGLLGVNRIFWKGHISLLHPGFLATGVTVQHFAYLTRYL